jgi:poly(3-hydroxybutyrate) depolymerase
LLQQISALGALRPIDRQRIWIVGWSGGGSYIGYRTQELEQTFAAIVIRGGGMPPEVATCPAAKTPVYFLSAVGTRFTRRSAARTSNERLMETGSVLGAHTRGVDLTRKPAPRAVRAQIP